MMRGVKSLSSRKKEQNEGSKNQKKKIGSQNKKQVNRQNQNNDTFTSPSNNPRRKFLKKNEQETGILKNEEKTDKNITINSKTISNEHEEFDWVNFLSVLISFSVKFVRVI